MYGGRTAIPLARDAYLVVLDEVQEIRTVLGKTELDPILQQLSRQMRASNGRLMVSTQRPDAEDAIPGAVRDMLEERIILGFVSATGARMVLDDDWREVIDEYGSDTVPGRGLARVSGRLVRIQGFNLKNPRAHPEVEHFYPPKLTATSAAVGTEGTATATRWAPHPVAEDAPAGPPDGAVADPDHEPLPGDVPEGDEPAETPTAALRPPPPDGEPSRPERGRRRHRTV